MADKFMQLVLTPAVRQAQDKYFGKHQVVENAPETDPLTRSEAYFIASRDSFYMATVSETGWPYVQHRGGPPGFVKVLGPNLIGFADFKGNRQLISTGNLDVTDRVALFMMDYPNRTRLKLLGHARVLDAREHPELVDQLVPEALRRKVERLFLIRVISYDWNCPQYITPRFTAAEMEKYVAAAKSPRRQIGSPTRRSRRLTARGQSPKVATSVPRSRHRAERVKLRAMIARAM
jgi:predicted pyridoxine 5'-phosphate oxidase superfamily flavin-nucleotide-binding protein